ncbi:MAG: alpha-glucan family phosphorylase [Gemmatimonadales bacterium]|jgi:starch phosphorylase
MDPVDQFLSAPEAPVPPVRLDPDEDLVAYFCMEFGLHEDLNLYSGGMGILAGDHIKAASDAGVPLVAVGLLYHQGYFNQTIDGDGRQQSSYTRANFAELPLTPAISPEGEPYRVSIELPGRDVLLNIWRVHARDIELFLLDSDVAENAPEDREITFQLYGGDRRRRLEQEIVLGIGGVRALRAMGYTPTVWHSNEGHSAFQILERCRAHVAAGADFPTALEIVAGSTVFTTHTPVPAGHDVFQRDLIVEHFTDLAGELGLDIDAFLALGANHVAGGGLDMTALAFRGSRFHNGVSRTHRRVAAGLDGYVWEEIPPLENPIIHVTNGVHTGTFLDPTWAEVFDEHLEANWRDHLCEPAYWKGLDELPDELVWNIRCLLKKEALGVVKARALQRLRRIGRSDAEIERATRWICPSGPDVLTVSFARRFATYKRATLVLSDPERLARLVNDENRPVVLLFAGKAHPRDGDGQQVIQTIHELSQQPEFEGRIVLLEGYDMSLAKAMLAGSDVWLNTPEYPLEASGTSGMKAGMNGTLNLSVLDGWWVEGFNTRNGWAIFPHAEIADREERDRTEADELLSLLEQQVVGAFYERDDHGLPAAWIAMVRASMRSIIPRFNALRMVQEYIARLYLPASRHGRLLRQDDNAGELSRWKQRLARIWPQVGIRRLGRQPGVAGGSPAPPSKVAVNLAGLDPSEVVVECVWGLDFGEPGYQVMERRAYRPVERRDNGEAVWQLDLETGFAASDLARYPHRVRAYPRHDLLADAAEPGRMRWLE